jgi:hypothetical protein
MPSSAHRAPLGSFVVMGVATFVLGGAVWMVTDLRAFDPISAGTVLGSAILWVMLGWMPSLAMGGLFIGTEILLGRHRGVRRRIGGVLTIASQGKLVEKKSVAEIMTAGHGSPFVAQVSMANANKLYRALLDGLMYRGVAFFQCFTTCQPVHGVPDDSSQLQAKSSAMAGACPS